MLCSILLHPTFLRAHATLILTYRHRSLVILDRLYLLNACGAVGHFAFPLLTMKPRGPRHKNEADLAAFAQTVYCGPQDVYCEVSITELLSEKAKLNLSLDTQV